MAVTLMLLVVASPYVLGFGGWRLPACVLALGIGAFFYGASNMASEIMHTREFVKQVAIWLSITTLLPLVTYYGSNAFQPPPDSDLYHTKNRDLEQAMSDAEDEKNLEERKRLRTQLNQLEDAHDEAVEVYQRRIFWVACPLGLVSLIVGTFLSNQPVGAGLMFGGLGSLTTGCYSYWDKMDGRLRLASLLLSLAIVIVLGLWRFRTNSSTAVQNSTSR